MTTPAKFRLSVNVQISNEQWSGGGVRIDEQVEIRTLTFSEMAKILEAFHTLIEEFRVK